MPPPTRCPACDVPPRPAGHIGPHRLLRCPRCRLAWWPWPEFDPAAFYDESYFAGDAPKGYRDYAALEPAIRRTASTRLRTLARCGARGGRLLDVGCGTGVFLDQARHAGWHATGVEAGPSAAERARQRGLSVTTADIAAFLADATGPYDCITLWDCIEHLPDPRGTLTGLARLLRPGGVLALSTGDVTSLCARWSGPRWHLYTFPEHLFFFSPQALRRLLLRARCDVVRVRREANWVTTGYIVERLGKTLLRRPAAGRSGGLLVPATLGDVLGVYAVRR